MRLLIFGDVNTPVPANAIRETLCAADEHDDLEVCGFVTTRPGRFVRGTPVERAQRGARRLLVAAANGQGWPRRRATRRVDAREFTSRGISIIVPDDGNVNSPSFLRRIETDLRPDVALSYFFGTIFTSTLLEQFPQAVNLHPALLPRYRGLRSVEIARYHGEPLVGLTWHRMTEKIDDGPILLQQQVRTTASESLFALTDRLAVAAAAAVPEVLDLIRSNAPGAPQQGAASYFSGRDVDALFNVPSPADIDADELRRRIWAFGGVRITIDGRVHRVTRLRASREGARLAFRTADGSVLAPDRIAGLPLALVRRSRASRSRH